MISNYPLSWSWPVLAPCCTLHSEPQGWSPEEQVGSAWPEALDQRWDLNTAAYHYCSVIRCLSQIEQVIALFQTLVSPVFILAVSQTGNVRVKSSAMLNKMIADFTLLSSLCEHATTVAQRRDLHRTLEIYCVQQQKCKRPAVVGNWTLSCATSALSMVEHWLHKPWVRLPVTASLPLSSILPWEHRWLFHREAGILCIIFFFIAVLLSLRHTITENIQSIAKHLAVHILRLVYQARPSLTFLLTFLEGERWSSVID